MRLRAASIAVGALAIAITSGWLVNYRNVVEDKSRTIAPSRPLKIIPCDMGILEVGTVASRELQIQNGSSSPWSAADIKGSCSCTLQELEPRTIGPGQSAKMTVQLHAGNSAGRMRREVLVRFRESSAPLYRVEVTATVRHWAELQPDSLTFPNLMAGHADSKQITLETFAPHELDPASVTCSLNWLKVTSESVLVSSESSAAGNQGASRSKCTIVATPPAGLKGGAYLGRISFSSKADSSRERSIPVRCTVTSPVSFVPAQVFFGFVEPGRPKARSIEITTNAQIASALPDRVAISHSVGDELRVELRPTIDERRFTLQAVMVAGSSPGLRSGTILVAIPGTSAVAIPVSALVSAEGRP